MLLRLLLWFCIAAIACWGPVSRTDSQAATMAAVDSEDGDDESDDSVGEMAMDVDAEDDKDAPDLDDSHTSTSLDDLEEAPRLQFAFAPFEVDQIIAPSETLSSARGFVDPHLRPPVHS